MRRYTSSRHTHLLSYFVCPLPLFRNIVAIPPARCAPAVWRSYFISSHTVLPFSMRRPGAPLRVKARGWQAAWAILCCPCTSGGGSQLCPPLYMSGQASLLHPEHASPRPNAPDCPKNLEISGNDAALPCPPGHGSRAPCLLTYTFPPNPSIRSLHAIYASDEGGVPNVPTACPPLRPPPCPPFATLSCPPCASLFSPIYSPFE